jgi:hypothetical protein
VKAKGVDCGRDRSSGRDASGLLMNLEYRLSRMSSDNRHNAQVALHAFIIRPQRSAVDSKLESREDTDERMMIRKKFERFQLTASKQL